MKLVVEMQVDENEPFGAATLMAMHLVKAAIENNLSLAAADPKSMRAIEAKDNPGRPYVVLGERMEPNSRKIEGRIVLMFEDNVSEECLIDTQKGGRKQEFLYSGNDVISKGEEITGK